MGRLSWHLPLRPSPLPSLRLMPMPTTATAMVLATTVLATTVWATGPTATTARGMLRLRLIPTTVSTLPTTLLPLLLAPPPSPPLALPPLPSLLLEEPTLVPAATSPTPP